MFGEWSVSQIVGLIALKGIDHKILDNRGWLIIVAILVGVLAGYYIVYLATPVPLELNIPPTLNRLMLHLWRSVLLVVGRSVKY